MRPTLSLIVLSYNTSDTTKKCLHAVTDALNKSKISAEILIVDNASTDGSAGMIREFQKTNKQTNLQITTIFNRDNKGYSYGNNQGVKIAKGDYILFLNSDAILEDIDFNELIAYFKENPKVGALTVKVVLPTGSIDPASHRGFPTIWNSFCYFLKLEIIFGKLPGIGQIFGGYHMTYLDLNTLHEIDSGTGAFYLVKKEVLDKVGGFDEKNFFMYGEDLDLSYRIKKAGYTIIYFPKFKVLHLKYQSGLKRDNQKIKTKTRDYFYDSMKTFYKKHYAKEHPQLFNNLMYFFIDIKKKIS